MSKLTDEERDFLARHDIPLSRVFDASGLSKRQRERAMRELGMEVAYGVPPCNAAGHTLRTRSGHCVQCGTHNLAFQRRYDEVGDVYIAYSKGARLVKVGTAQTAINRLETLKYFQYGGTGDWALYSVERCECAARIELQTQRALFRFRHVAEHEKQGVSVTCQELFRCTPKQAISALEETIKEEGDRRAI